MGFLMPPGANGLSFKPWLSQPHLHPDKLNGALWFGIDPCIRAFIRATWQGYYMGPWKSWRKVPEERKDSWWQTFVEYWATDAAKRKASRLFSSMKSITWSSSENHHPTLPLSGRPARPDGTFVDYRAKNWEHAPSSRVPNGLARNLELEMRVGGLETALQSVTTDVAGVKQDVAGVKQDVSDMRQDFAATREAINQFILSFRPPQAPTGQTSDQPQASTAQPNPPNGF
ncbi:hypothetical protein Bca52824_032590 [Brassica carinata]|uniref:Uncharacterized protein n=1 Tax=Brassica carinata TaxID=52824 RepID=A0A8X7SH63_BRACI|nr:hypothetical protein Bca52824_032590 [Brassica carinata]